jgi:uncharacterized protein with NAD-binding domain and iron-sulfur cluster
MERAHGKTSIAILGGGVGSLAAAFDLTEVDPDGKLYDITIYQVGWRLGGKGAVGWTCEKYPTPTFENQQVQLEHGLHVWAGFYDNAFDLLQRCYAAHDRPPYPSYLTPFTPVNRCWVMDDGTGAWERWELDVPPNRLIPGISRLPPSSPALWGRLLAFVTKGSQDEGLRTHVENARGRIPVAQSAQNVQFAQKARRVADGLSKYPMGVGQGQRARFRELVDFAINDLHEEYFDENLVDAGHEPLLLTKDVRRLAIMVNIGLALLLGMLDSKVLVTGFDTIDRWEWSYWMGQYGAWTMSLQSGLVRGFYDYVFGFDSDGRPAVAAGTSTRAFLHLLCAYKGSLFYKLNVTMGEFLFAPVYEVLLKRGVKFQFFSCVEKLHLSQDKKNIERIDIGVQAYLLDEGKPYQPLIDTPDGQRKTWPNRPDYAQLKDGDRIYATLLQDEQDLESPWNSWGVVDTIPLRRDKGDFDKVILGIGLGALKYICSDLCNEPALAWGEMVSSVSTCPTLATQLWVNMPTSSFSWPAENAIVTAFASPLNTWGDNSQLIAQELWPNDAKPASFAYFVGNLPDDPLPTPGTPDPFPVAQLQKATTSVQTWLHNDLPVLWPGYQPAYLERDPYVRVNVNPSDRYVQSVPGSVESRLRPDGSGVDNLYLAGDWVRIGLNAGCIEQAVLGGRAAARAITGVDMNSSYDNDRNWNDDGPISPALVALLANLPDLTRLALAGVGSVEACCIVDYIQPAVIEKMLPPGLTLNLPARFPEKLPICLVFSEQRNVRPAFVPLGGITYMEFSIIFHDVYNLETNDDYNGPFIYMPRILLNSFPAAAIGVKAYGFNKRLARIRRVGNSFNIRNDEGEISARFEDASLLGQIGDFPELSIVRGILDQPVISETAEGGWITSQLDYHLDQASFQSLKGHCYINQGPYSKAIDFIGVPGPPNPEVEAGRIAFPSLGFRMVTNWDLTLPIRVGEHDGLLPTPKRMHATAITNRLISRLRSRR